MINDLIKLYKDGKELTLLEITYFALSIASFAVAGVLALFNQALGLSVLIVPLIAFIAGIMNVVAWALVKLIIEHLMNSKKAAKTAEKAEKITKK